MSELDQKVKGSSNSRSTPQRTAKKNEDELPPEVALSIIYSQARDLEKIGRAQILRATNKGEPVIYVRLIGVDVGKIALEDGKEANTFIIAKPVPTQAEAEK